jgi:very-short-patch-repair endonuclease
VPSLGGSEAVDVARPLRSADLDHAIQLYLAGEPVQQIPAKSGVSLSRLQRERVARGVPARGHDLPMDDIIRAYQSGATELALARQYDVARGTITNRLVAAGVPRRGLSEATRIASAAMTKEQRKARAAAAHAARRAGRISDLEKRRNALRKERLGNFDSQGEQALYSWIWNLGERPTVQRAIGPYNVDMAVLPVAVEVLGGGWHATKSEHSERTPYILDAGWHLVMVWDYEGASALGPGAADYVVAFADEVRRNPPATCQYRVITGQGELLAACGRESDEFPLVPPPRGRLMAGA